MHCNEIRCILRVLTFEERGAGCNAVLASTVVRPLKQILIVR